MVEVQLFCVVLVCAVVVQRACLLQTNFGSGHIISQAGNLKGQVILITDLI